MKCSNGNIKEFSTSASEEESSVEVEEVACVEYENREKHYIYTGPWLDGFLNLYVHINHAHDIAFYHFESYDIVMRGALKVIIKAPTTPAAVADKMLAHVKDKYLAYTVAFKNSEVRKGEYLH